MKKIKNNHSKAFWTKKYKEIKQFARDNGVPFPFKNKNEFISDWEALRADGVKDVTKEIKYSMKYQTSYKTALAEKQALEKLDIRAPKFAELKKMSTKDFAKKYETELANEYRSLKAEGATGKEAAEYISSYWFGSK